MHEKLAAQTVEFIATSSALSDRLMGEVQVHREKQARAKTKQSAILDLMLKEGAVLPHMRQDAANMLKDHAATLDLLANAVTKMAQYKNAAERQSFELGQAVSEKTANSKSSSSSYDSLNDSYVGRRTTEKKASDRALLAILDAPAY